MDSVIAAYVGRHAQAKNVTVVVDAPNELLVVTVADDGVGFDPDAVLYESGIATMRMFAGLGRGVLDIQSGSGIGTTVRVELGGAEEQLPDPPPERGPLRLIVGGVEDDGPTVSDADPKHRDSSDDRDNYPIDEKLVEIPSLVNRKSNPVRDED